MASRPFGLRPWPVSWNGALVNVVNIMTFIIYHNKYYLLRVTANGPTVTCKQQDGVCLHNLFSSLHERMDDPPPIACSIIALIAVYEPIYYVSNALRDFLVDAPGATLRAPYRYPRT